MRTKTPTGKASKGSVQVIASNRRLQLRFRYAGKRRYLSLGLPDDRDNRLAAEMKARQIQLDILSGNFDETLDKYRILLRSKGEPRYCFASSVSCLRSGSSVIPSLYLVFGFCQFTPVEQLPQKIDLVCSLAQEDNLAGFKQDF